MLSVRVIDSDSVVEKLLIHLVEFQLSDAAKDHLDDRLLILAVYVLGVDGYVSALQHNRIPSGHVLDCALSRNRVHIGVVRLRPKLIGASHNMQRPARLVADAFDNLLQPRRGVTINEAFHAHPGPWSSHHLWWMVCPAITLHALLPQDGGVSELP